MSLDSRVPDKQGQLLAALESLLIISSEPVPVEALSRVLGVGAKEILEALRILQFHYEMNHGFRLVRISGGWQLSSAPEQAEAISRFRDSFQNQPLRLSRAALETLAVVAYKQPVTRGEIEEIRGVRSDKVIETLLRLGLIRIAGKRKGTGTPMLFRTTATFLDAFSLDSISELPDLKDLEDSRVPEFLVDPEEDR